MQRSAQRPYGKESPIAVQAVSSLIRMPPAFPPGEPAMFDYLPIKHIHVLLALTSGMGFALRGFIRLVLSRPLQHRLWKILPHVVDTLLLATGVTLWILAGWPLLSWLGAKLTLVLAYILLGAAAFRAANRQRAVALYLAALLVFLGIAALAVHKPL